jgi:hypothetical protein
MPDYAFLLEDDIVIVRPKREAVQGTLPLQLSYLRLAADTHEDARRLAPGWDMYHLENEWRSWVLEKAISVKDPDKHFLSFCKKRGAHKM